MNAMKRINLILSKTFLKELFEYIHHMMYKKWIESKKKLLFAIIIVLVFIPPRENIGE